MLCVVPVHLATVYDDNFIRAIAALETYENSTEEAYATEAIDAAELKQNGSPTNNAAIAAATAFQAAIRAWEHKFAAQLNSNVGKTFHANEKQIKLLHADLNRYAQEMRELENTLNNRGVNERIDIPQRRLYEEVKEKHDETIEKIRELHSTIRMSHDMYNGIEQSNSLAKAALTKLQKFYDTYSIMNPITTRDYCSLMDTLTHDLREGKERREINVLCQSADEIYRTNVVGKQVNTDNGDSFYSIKQFAEMGSLYNEWTKAIRSMYEKAGNIRDEIAARNFGQAEDPRAKTAISELAFLIEYAQVYSDIIDLYFKPQISVIDSVVS